MKYPSVLWFFLVFTGCTNNTGNINSGLLKKYTPSEKGIIISCVRCSCVLTDLKNYMDSNNFTNNAAIYSDTNCLEKNLFENVHHLDQKKLDSAYSSNYNIILFKTKPDKIEYRLIKTEESATLQTIANDFFKK